MHLDGQQPSYSRKPNYYCVSMLLSLQCLNSPFFWVLGSWRSCYITYLFWQNFRNLTQRDSGQQAPQWWNLTLKVTSDLNLLYPIIFSNTLYKTAIFSFLLIYISTFLKQIYVFFWPRIVIISFLKYLRVKKKKKSHSFTQLQKSTEM